MHKDLGSAWSSCHREINESIDNKIVKELENILSGCLFQYVAFLNNKWIALSVLYLEIFLCIYAYSVNKTIFTMASWIQTRRKLSEKGSKSKAHAIIVL